jgi:hypothetical protein
MSREIEDDPALRLNWRSAVAELNARMLGGDAKALMPML